MAKTLHSAARYAAAVTNVLPRGGARDLRRRLLESEDRLVFVVGSPRSGTTFLAGAIGAVPGFVDLGEVTPLKAAIPRLVQLPERDAAVELRRVLERVRRLSLVRGLRGVEQTPETAFVVGAALQAYPHARAVHLIRDGRDVVCSLLERGWLSADRGGGDDAGLSYGARARFWVEPDRRAEFEAASDATRAAWAWRTYVAAARRVESRLLDLRYESLVDEPHSAAARLAEHLGVDAAVFAGSLDRAHDRSVGRFRRDLTEAQLADVEREAGPLLAELGYGA
jgi:hypothetical protein